MLLGGAMAKIRVSYEYTEAEDKSIRLGFFLIVSGILSLFILGFCWLNPALQDLQCKAANCTVLSVQIGDLFECTFTCGADCKGTSLYPCLQIYVNNSESNARALLHQDEHQLLTNPKCSFIPPCERENQKNSETVTHLLDYWREEVGSQPFPCYFNQHLRVWPFPPVYHPSRAASAAVNGFLTGFPSFVSSQNRNGEDKCRAGDKSTATKLGSSCTAAGVVAAMNDQMMYCYDARMTSRFFCTASFGQWSRSW
ncbi:calcium-activated potassium channel subunit beta-4 isoform X2 [Hemicordylus capensis]|uniref:calcium-activated potassium channel subunit beta-4 isoform X2 n=1 Tax=Hemicordylus capensis TaxID=884348 RepID=UPI0023026EFD|nr:calcium-activated potassium channel subunit beta-4 isoform X2 [Hemicordylus capensis]